MPTPRFELRWQWSFGPTCYRLDHVAPTCVAGKKVNNVFAWINFINCIFTGIICDHSGYKHNSALGLSCAVQCNVLYNVMCYTPKVKTSNACCSCVISKLSVFSMRVLSGKLRMKTHKISWNWGKHSFQYFFLWKQTNISIQYLDLFTK